MCCACWPRVCVASHVLCSVLYIGAGAVQLIAGIFFLISLPVFKVGSNLWTGVWNVVVGVGGAVFSCVGELTPSKHRILLYLTISVLVLNVINLVVLELGEWRILMPESVKTIIEQRSLQTLVLYARMTTSISTALAVVVSFIDAQFMFCWLEHSLRPRSPLDHKETVSDIEYIIPRLEPNSGTSNSGALQKSKKSICTEKVKSGSMGKNNPHNLYNQYAAQSWVFDTDTVGSSQSESPYSKLQQFSGSKTVVLKRKNKPIEKEQCNNLAPPITAARSQPVVLVEDTSNNERQLQFMTSFSRTPSPVGPDSDSSSPCSNPPPIYECLERLTEPSVYRSRLNTALVMNVDRPSPSVSPRPHSVVVTDQVQYASLMVELEKTIGAKFPSTKTPTDSQSITRYSSRRASSRDESHHKSSASDTEFSKELEAALQLIQDLESPNTVETPSDGPQHLAAHHHPMNPTRDDDDDDDRTNSFSNNNNNNSRSTSSDDDNSFSGDSREALHRTVTGKECSRETDAAVARTESQKKHTTVIHIRPDDYHNYRENMLDAKVRNENEVNAKTVNGVSHLSNAGQNDSGFAPYDSDDDHNCTSLENYDNLGTRKANGISSSTLIRNGECRLGNELELSGFSVISEEDGDGVEHSRQNGVLDRTNNSAVSSSGSRSNSLRRSLSSVARWRMFNRKKTARFVLTPELESTILKSESLFHLTDVELVARYDRNKSEHRKIEEKVWQRINGASNSDSSC